MKSRRDEVPIRQLAERLVQHPGRDAVIQFHKDTGKLERLRGMRMKRQQR